MFACAAVVLDAPANHGLNGRACSFFETVETHEWIFRYRRGFVVEGELAAILMAISMVAGAYLVATSCRRMRAGHSEDGA